MVIEMWTEKIPRGKRLPLNENGLFLTTQKSMAGSDHSEFANAPLAYLRSAQCIHRCVALPVETGTEAVGQDGTGRPCLEVVGAWPVLEETTGGFAGRLSNGTCH